MPQYMHSLSLSSHILGKGRNGVIHEASVKGKKEPVAVKLLCQENESIPSSFYKELVAFHTLGNQHPNIIQFYDQFMWTSHVGKKKKRKRDTEERFGFVIEKCDTNLRHFLLSQKDSLEWAEIQEMMKQILEAVAYCHSHHIWHQDISSSNILCKFECSSESKEPEPEHVTLKLSDFGMSIFEVSYARPRPFQPTLSPTFESHLTTGWYRAPELFDCSMRLTYSNKIDMWSVGCIFAELLTKGAVLFQTEKGTDQEQKQRYLEFKENQSEKTISCSKIETFIPRLKENEQAKDLFYQLLKEAPEERISAKEALNHRFFS